MSSLNFEYKQIQLNNTAKIILDKALELGASSAQVEISESIAKSVDVLNSNIENFETSYSSSMSLQVYIGSNRGSVGVSQISPANIDEIINRALDIAKFTESDPHNGIAEPELLCKSINFDLGLFNPVEITNKEMIKNAMEIESIGRNFSPKIKNSDGASVNYGLYNFVLANTNGLNLGYQTSRYAKSLCLIGENKHGMQTDSWYDSSLDYQDLISNEQLASIAAKRTIRRLDKGQITTGKYPVIFESTIAKSLVGSFLGAINGSNLFRHLTFLDNSIDTSVFPNWLNIIEDPFIIKGSSSCYFDNEGVSVCKRDLVKNGVVKGYLLNCYTSRKLGLQSTGNAGGHHNIIVPPNFKGDITTLAQKITNGLIVIETIGHGLNMVTGDYSVGASGLWVEKGNIQFFVDGLTISGNLKEIFKNIEYISDDYNKHGSIACGSMLVNQITVSV